MKLIWKFPLPADFVVGGQTDCMIEMPAEGEIVHIEVLENTRIVLWFQFSVPHDWDGHTPTQKKYFFRRVGTGHPIPDRYNHIQTFFSEEFVWHVHVFKDDADGTT